jgi:hypothetical protein
LGDSDDEPPEGTVLFEHPQAFLLPPSPQDPFPLQLTGELRVELPGLRHLSVRHFGVFGVVHRHT